MAIDTTPLKTPEPLAPPAAFEQLTTEGVFDQPAWLLPMRRAAIARFADQGFPTLRHEDWRFTSLAAVAALPFRPVLHRERHGLRLADVEPHFIANLEGQRLVFVDGHFAAELSRIQPEPGVVVGSLAEHLAARDAAVREHLGQLATHEENPFAALNTAFLQDGAFVQVESGIVASPVHLIFLGSGTREGAAVHVRNLICASRGSRCSVIESYASLGAKPTVTNTVAEVLVDDRAVVEHVKIQQESDRAFHLATVGVEVNRSGQHRYHSMALGAKLSRTMIHTTLAGERVESELNGLYLVAGDQLADHFMVVEHSRPHGTSHEHFHGILAGQAKGVFHGRIRVHPGAQKTDAKQTNRNLLLSESATVDSKPQLEIYADDVKCTHAATVGQLDEDAVFYLRSRGIGPEQARRILGHAFAAAIVDRIQCAPVREHLDRVVWKRLEEIPELSAHD